MTSQRPRATVALNMIVKDCAEGLERALDSAQDVGFDEVVIVDTGSSDRTPEIAERRSDIFRTYTNYEPIEYEGKSYLSDFAGARDYARILSQSDYIFFLDSDDTISSTLGLRKFLDEKIRSWEHDGFFMTYDYEHDDYGNCVYRHPVLRCAERLAHAWRSPIHEVMCAVFHPRKTTLPRSLSRIIHHGKSETAVHRCGRNAAVAEFWIKKLGEENVEPRLWLNYGKSLVTLRRFDEAVEALHKYIDGSTWNQERYFARLLCGQSRMEQARMEEAVDEYLKAVRTCPRAKEAYLDLAKSFTHLKDYRSALHFLDVADLVSDEVIYQSNPDLLESMALASRAAVHYQLENFEDCIRTCDKVLNLNPTDARIMKMKLQASQLLRREDLIRSFKKVEFMVSREGSPEKIQALHAAIPRSIENEPEFCLPLKVNGTRTRVAIICGECPEAWGPRSHIEGGIGGSETAVIHMSRELTKLGYAVEVYGFPEAGDEGLHDGVLWVPYWRFTSAPEPDVLVSWRTPQWITWSPNARARYIWLHDVQVRNAWHPELYEWLDGAFFLSKFHRTTAPWVPDEKVILSANGIDESFFREGKHDPRRCLYASGPDRGLDDLLRMWPDIREAHPEATLDLCYGFSPLFRKSMETSERYRQIYNDVIRMIEQPGVKWHGRVSQEDLAQITADCGVWLYPTSFPEISCITAMQAQVNGAVPVTTGYAALSETVRHGVVVGGPAQVMERDKEMRARWLSEAIKVIGNEKRQEKIREEMVPWARKNLLWSSIASQWHERFQKDLKRSSVTCRARSSETSMPLSK